MTLALSRVEKSALSECEEIIERGRDTFVEVGNALLRIRNERLYRAGFGTFQEYCEAKWEMSDRHARRLIDAAEIAGNLESGPNGPVSESVTRPLSKLAPSKQKEAWQHAVDSSPTGKPTARQIAEAVEVTSLPRAERIHYRQSNGLQYAQMAIAALEKIQPNDKERDAAFDKVASWLKANR